MCLKNFYLRRAYRILPAATAYMLPVMIIHRHELTWYHAATAVLYLADFDPTKPLFLRHLWSLSVEEQFYLLWPSVLKKWYRHKTAILLTVVALVPVYQVVSYALHIRHFDFFAVADSLAIGCLLAILAPRIPSVKAWLACAMLVPIVFTPGFLGVSRSRSLLLLFVLWPLTNISIAGVLLRVIQTPPRLLNVAPVVWLGRISYSLYLWQEVFVFDGQRRPWYYILLAIGMASLSFYLVELPILRLRDRHTSATRRAAPALMSREEAVKIA
jgi:peptidoglycan/LPS O-acetylase OafA/YrhL